MPGHKLTSKPQISGGADSKYYPEGYLSRANAERAKTTATRSSSWKENAQYVPTFTVPDDETAAPAVIGVPEAYTFYEACKARSDAAGVEWPNKMTLQSLWHNSRWEPTREIAKIGDRPVLYVVATQDKFIPLAEQKKVFAQISGPKELVELESEHLDTYMGEVFEVNVARQTAWLKKNL